MIAAEGETRQWEDSATEISEEGGVCRCWEAMGERSTIHVLQGIDLVYHNIQMEACCPKRETGGETLEIRHCRRGSVEWERSEEVFYLGQGDTAILKRDGRGHRVCFPLGHYEGVSLLIHLEEAPACLSGVLTGVNVSPKGVGEKFCGEGRLCIFRGNAQLRRIFSDFYTAPVEMQAGYVKLKVLELFLLLGAMERPEENARRGDSRQQMLLAKSVCQYLAGHMDSHVTLAELSAVFHVSGTQLKNAFKRVYGTSVYAYSRAQKMAAAAACLRQTSENILTIAGRFGYDNGSKFAKAFSAVMGVTPTEYRMGKAPEEWE